MNLYYFDDDKINVFTLPNKIVGNFWMTDSKERNVVNISANDDKWYITGGNNSKIIVQNAYVDRMLLNNKQYMIIERNGGKNILFVDDVIDNTFLQYKVNSNVEIKLGNSSANDIYINNSLYNDVDISFVYNQGWFLKKNINSRVYLNNEIVTQEEFKVTNGDVLNIYGVKVVFVFDILFINNPLNNLVVNMSNLSQINLGSDINMTDEEILDEVMYKEEDYFLKSPRLRRVVKTFDMRIDSPPQKENTQEVPILYTLGPMITMGASSIVTLSTTFSKINSGESTFKENAPTLIVSCAMLASMLVWPFLTKMYNKKMKKKREEERQLKYKSYIDTKKKELSSEYSLQTQILEENLLTTDVCYDVIVNKRRTLWERKIEQADFLNVRVGKGKIPFDVNISYQSEDFTMDDDNLRKSLEGLINEYNTLNNVPIGYSFADNNITAVSGLNPKKDYFVDNCLLQMMAFHSYDNLKIVVFTNKNSASRWEYLKNSPYCFSNEKDIRFFAVNTEEMQDVSLYLEQVFNGRKAITNSDKDRNVYSGFNCYYLILIDDIDMARKIDIVENVLESKVNYGFSILIMEDKLSKLPSQCNNFISIGDKTSGILKNQGDVNEQVYFVDEISNKYDMVQCSYVLANLPIYIDSNQNKLPSTVTFLEMFGVGNVEQLNSLNRWRDNNPTKTLKTEIGINDNGDSFILDLHEKQHGPHGLIAGMTGSGKSESIITYILSMAVNYSPEEVAFVLIDYKGGGLAGAFVNKELGIKLPHVVGTITNLDKAEINRSLASIESELRRRQEKFNEVRDMTGESTIDIYKYQRLYRDKVIDEPIPHLIIVCDEFAELKQQQPDFMDDLISAARIGRSLGVHLILATQKPSGVVDAQIWSNSKFKICLKVQDKSDSMEMIKRSDAAELKNVGRFYLQVGYDEYFAIGQSAWAGAPYYANSEFKKTVDKNLYAINNIGNVNKFIDNFIAKKVVKSDGDELSSVLKYLIGISSSMNFKIRQLWLDRIPEFISLDSLRKKYNYVKSNFMINPVIGEYDNPSEQRQGLLTLPITMDGNVLVYGSSDGGRDEFLQTLVYSIITTYDTSEVNLYLLDYGSETLMNFNFAPQVGDVILNGDDEKLGNLIKMLTSEINKRKKIFLSYNGNYVDYIKLSNEKLPNIIVVINVVEVMTETYTELFDKLFTVIREGAKYGINFVLTTTNQNSIRFKVAQSCKQVLCLQLNNDTEYRDILGKTNGLVPFKCLGRGLVKQDVVCEFQTASIAKDEELLVTIKNTIDVLNKSNLAKARAIPVMPEKVLFSKLKGKFSGLDTVPVGIYKESLNVCTYDFKKHVANIISANEYDKVRLFINNFVNVLENGNNFNKLVIDANNYFDSFDYKVNYVNANFNKVIDDLGAMDHNIYDIYTKNNMNVRALENVANQVCVIVGLDKFLGKLDDEHKTKFKEILNHNKEMLKINFVFIDIPSGFKKYEYEEWYKNNIDPNNGIWIGDGVTQQYVLKTLIQPSGISDLDKDYGIVIINGVPKITKLLNDDKV